MLKDSVAPFGGVMDGPPTWIHASPTILWLADRL